MHPFVVCAVETNGFFQSVVLYGSREHDGVMKIGHVESYILDESIVHPGRVQGE